MKTIVDFFVIVIMTLTVLNGVLLTGVMGSAFMRPGMAQRGSMSSSNKPSLSSVGNMHLSSPMGNMLPLSSMRNMQPSSMRNMQSSFMGNMQPSSMGNMQPLSTGNMQPSSMGSMQPSSMGNMQPSFMGNMQPSSMGNMQPSSMGNMQPLSMGKMVPRPSVGLSQNTKKVEIANTDMKNVIPIIDNGGLDPIRKTELNLGVALKSQPASDLAKAVDADLLPGPQIVTNVETANTDNRLVENVKLSNTKNEDLAQDVESKRNEVHTNLGDAIKDESVKDAPKITDNGHLPLADKDNWKMTGNENWEDIKPTHGEENKINSEIFDIDSDDAENDSEVKDGDYDYQETVNEWLTGDDESADNDYEYDDDEYMEEVTVVTSETAWDISSTTEKWDNPDSADSDENVAAGKMMMDSTHHFDNNFGAFAGAKVGKGYMDVNKSSVYNWTFPSIAVMLALFFIFWNRQKVAKYYVSMRLPNTSSSQNGQPRRRDEEKDLLHNEYA